MSFERVEPDGGVLPVPLERPEGQLAERRIGHRRRDLPREHLLEPDLSSSIRHVYTPFCSDRIPVSGQVSLACGDSGSSASSKRAIFESLGYAERFRPGCCRDRSRLGQRRLRQRDYASISSSRRSKEISKKGPLPRTRVNGVSGLSRLPCVRPPRSPLVPRRGRSVPRQERTGNPDRGRFARSLWPRTAA